MDLREMPDDSDARLSRHPWELARRDVALRLIERFAPHAGRLLDIGCGDGFILFSLARRRPDLVCIGVDSALDDERKIALLSSASVKNVSLHASLDELDAQTSPFDLVLLLDVIEHIEDDVRFLEDLRSRAFVRDGTIALVTAPAFESFTCSRDELLGHYRRHTLRSLTATCAQADWRVLETHYAFTSLLPLRAAQVIFERLFPATAPNAHTALTHWSAPAIVSDALSWLLSIDYKFCRAFRRLGFTAPGLSCVALIQK